MVLAVAAQAAMVALQVVVQADEAGTSSWMSRLALLIPVPLVLYMIWRLYLNPYVAFEQDRLRVNNIFTRYLVPYHLITVLEGRTALTLDVSGHGRLPVYAFGAAIIGRAQRDAVAEELLRRRDAAVRAAGGGFEKRSTIGLPEWLGPGLTGALFLVAIVASEVG
ncbi:hypothetical protein ACGFT2_19700 [Streptomyces sp. NPDC048514]|uniref:hypothetical protein n=1 Tax=Streptomyces sp. NPDC048514 TaxID=3365564 RepID=UPI00371B73E4